MASVSSFKTTGGLSGREDKGFCVIACHASIEVRDFSGQGSASERRRAGPQSSAAPRPMRNSTTESYPIDAAA